MTSNVESDLIEKVEFDGKTFEEIISNSLLERKDLNKAGEKSCLNCFHHCIKRYVIHECSEMENIIYDDTKENDYNKLRKIAQDCFLYTKNSRHHNLLKITENERKERIKKTEDTELLLEI